MKTKLFLSIFSIAFVFFSSQIESQAQASRAMSQAWKLAPKVFKSTAKSTTRGVAVSTLKSSNNKANIEGDFYQFPNGYGGNFYAFSGINKTNKSLTITFYAVNEVWRRQMSYVITLGAGESFYFGTPHGWHWQRGEKMIIKYSNGDKVYWVFN